MRNPSLIQDWINGWATLHFAAGVKSITIGDAAFFGCRSLKSLVFPAGVKNITIGSRAFLVILSIIYLNMRSLKGRPNESHFQ